MTGSECKWIGGALGILFVGAALAFSGCSQTNSSNAEPPAASESPTPAPAQEAAKSVKRVVVQEVRQGSINQTIRSSGSLKADEEIMVAAKAGGTVMRRQAEEGESVEKGQRILEVDNALQFQQVKQAEAQYYAVEANLKKVRDATRPEEKKQAEAALAAAQSRYDNMKEEYARLTKLSEEGVTSKQNVDAIKSQMDMSAAQVQSAEEGLKLAESGARVEDIEAVESQLKAAEATWKLAQRQYDDAFLTAPLSGKIARWMTDVGEAVGPGMPVALIVNDRTMVLTLGVSDREVGQIQNGQQARVSVDAWPDEAFEGVVTKIGLVADPAVKTFPVEVSIDNGDGKLKSGMLAHATLVVGQKDGGIVIPFDATLLDAGQRIVYLEENGTAKRRDVQLGGADGNIVEVLDGLKVGDRLVVVGQSGLSDGIGVEAVEER